MSFRFLPPTPGAVLLLSLAACSGRGSPVKVDTQSCGPGATRGTALCRVSCSLGCTLRTCSLTEISQNQQVTFVFSQELDPRSIDSSSVPFRTASGGEPVGHLVVARDTVTFVPESRIVGSRKLFGFRANETYALSLSAGAEPEAVLSTAGDGLAEDLNCSLRVSRGVVDADGRPPQATLRSPNEDRGVDLQAPIVLEWSELIDAAPVFSARTHRCVFGWRETRTVAGEVERDPAASNYDLLGSWRVENDPFTWRTRATFAASQAVPGAVGVQSEASDRVRDMAGNAGGSQSFRYLVRPLQRAPVAIHERFDNDLQLDADGSSDAWTGGVATPGRIGGSGRLGVFNIENGQLQGDTHVWNVDHLLVPRTQTLSGQYVVVADGVFEFERFVLLPNNRTLRFVGSRQPRICSRGVIDIQSMIDVRAIDNPAHVPGMGRQAAGAPGPFVGRSSPLPPASARNGHLTDGSRRYSLQSTSAGGGGGHLVAGADGTSSSMPGAPAAGAGIAFDVFPVPSDAIPQRAVGDVRIRGGGRLLASGGASTIDILAANAQGSSGGTGAIQRDGVSALLGGIDALGGVAASGRQRETSVLLSRGDGGAGMILLPARQAPAPSVFGDARAAPSAGVGSVRGGDPVVGATSKFYLTGQLFSPEALPSDLVARAVARTTTLHRRPEHGVTGRCASAGSVARAGRQFKPDPGDGGSGQRGAVA